MLTRRMYNFPGFGLAGPFAEFERMKRQMDALSDFFARGSSPERSLRAGVFPLINLTENKNAYYLRAELPGMKAEDIRIEVTGRNVTISGERKITPEGDNVRYHRSERGAWKFSRVVGLPGDINPESVKACMENGMLTVSLPKSEAAKPKQITVQ